MNAPTAHSRFGGSSASRWLNCPGSVALAEQLPPKAGSSYAEEGTFAHALAEMCLGNGDTAADRHLGKTVQHPSLDSEKVVTQEMIDAVNVYLDTVWETVDADPNTMLFVEERFELPVPSADEGEVFGTNDAMTFCHSTGRLTVFDYKHGQGVAVSAFENKQLMFYAAGAVASHPEWDVASIELVIVQPRAFQNAYDGVSRWEMELWQLLDYPAAIEAAVAQAKSDAPTMQAGDHCRWCPAAELCPVREQNFLEAAKLDFATVADVTAKTKLPQVEEMDPARMSAILEGFDHLAAWVDTIRDRVNSVLMEGGEVPGWKVVAKQARRRWVDNEEEIAGYLTMVHGLDDDAVRPRKLVTITEAEKQLKAALSKDDFATAKEGLTLGYTLKEPSGLTIAPESDRRPAVAPNSAEFGTVNLSGLFDNGE